MWLLAASAWAAETVAPDVMFGGGPGGGYGIESSVGGSAGVAGVWFPTTRVGLQAEVREGFWSDEVRSLGQIGFGLRYRATPALDVWGGFAHNHETPLAVLEDDPVGSVAGVAKGIHHRSGGELGASYGWAIDRQENLNVIFRLETAVSAFPDRWGPPLYAQVFAHLWFEIPTLARHRADAPS